MNAKPVKHHVRIPFNAFPMKNGVTILSIVETHRMRRPAHAHPVWTLKRYAMGM